MNNRKILITGGAGYIGSVLSLRLLEKGFHLKVFDNISQSKDGLDQLIHGANFEFFEGDLRDLDSIKKSLYGVDIVIHLAGISDGRSGRRNPNLTIEVNQSTFSNFVSEAKKQGVSMFIFASTFGIYGNQYKTALVESFKPNPEEVYSQTKLYGESLLKQYSDSNFKVRVLRIAMVYGVSPRMRFDFIVNNMTIKALTIGKISVLGGMQRRPQIHILDLSDIIIKFIEDDNSILNYDIINIGESNPSILEIAQEIQRQTLCKLEILPMNKNETSFVLDINKSIVNYRIRYKYAIANGIEEIIEMFNNNKWEDINNNKYYN